MLLTLSLTRLSAGTWQCHRPSATSIDPYQSSSMQVAWCWWWCQCPALSQCQCSGTSLPASSTTRQHQIGTVLIAVMRSFLRLFVPCRFFVRYIQKTFPPRGMLFKFILNALYLVSDVASITLAGREFIVQCISYW